MATKNKDCQIHTKDSNGDIVKFFPNTKIENVENLQTRLSNILDANGKKQLIPIFGSKASGNVIYRQNGTAITVSGTKTAGEANYIQLIDPAPTYADLNLSAGETIVVSNDNEDVYVGIIFWGQNTGYTSTISIQNETKEIILPADKEKIVMRIYVRSALSSVNETIHPLICKKELFDISSAVTPYAMSNAELTAAIIAIQAQLNS